MMLAMSTAAVAHNAVTWDVDRAIIAGSGCMKDVSAFAIQNGDELSILFTSLGVDLPAGSHLPNAQRKSCAIRVPTQIEGGLYVSELIQEISYGVTKSSRSRGALATVSSFFGMNVGVHQINLPYGTALNEPLIQSRREDHFLVDSTWHDGFCRQQRPLNGLYSANMAVSGQRSSDREDLIMFIDGLDLKYDVMASISPCFM